MGGELEELGDSTTTDFRFGREAGNSGVFLFLLAFFKIGTVVGVAGALVETLVLLLFGGVFFSCCIFRLSWVIGILSSESSVEILSMGMEGLVLLGDGVNSGYFCCLFIFSNLQGVFAGVVREYALFAEGFPKGFVQACRPFAEEVLHLAEVCPQLDEEFPLLDEEFPAQAVEFFLRMGINGGWRVI
jgi:hypothetical protein